MTLPHLFATAAALLVALPLSTGTLHAQREDASDLMRRCRAVGWNDSRYHEVRETGFRPSGAIRVDGGQNGGIHVTSWNRDSVHVMTCVHVRAWDDDEGRDIARRIRVVANANEVRAESDDADSRRDWMVQFVLFVPERSDLNLTANNGPVSVRRVNGRQVLETRNGPLSLEEVSGDVRGRTRNGPLRVVLAGSRWDGRGLDVETTNGPLTLHVPDGYSAHLVTGTSNGPIRVDIPMTLREWNGRRIDTELGSGGATIRVVTSNGPATIRRASQ